MFLTWVRLWACLNLCYLPVTGLPLIGLKLTRAVRLEPWDFGWKIYILSVGFSPTCFRILITASLNYEVAKRTSVRTGISIVFKCSWCRNSICVCISFNIYDKYKTVMYAMNSLSDQPTTDIVRPVWVVVYRDWKNWDQRSPRTEVKSILYYTTHNFFYNLKYFRLVLLGPVAVPTRQFAVNYWMLNYIWGNEARWRMYVVASAKQNSHVIFDRKILEGFSAQISNFRIIMMLQ